MRRRLAVLAAVPLIFAAACGSQQQTGGGEAVSGPKVTGNVGAKPTVTFPQGSPAGKSSVEVLSPGTGASVAKGDTVFVNLSVWSWDGKQNTLEGSTYDTKKTEPITVNDQMPKVMIDGFGKTKLGGRFMTVVANDSYTEQELAQAKQNGMDTSKPRVFVFDLISTLPKAATGKASDPGVKGVTVTSPGGDAAPTLTTKTSAKPPAKLVNKTVIEGTGAEVKKNQSVVVHYTGKLWGTDKQFDSSWGKDPFTVQGVGTGQVIKGWDQALEGAKVGSRLLLVIPPNLGYGDAPSGEIPAKSTLVFVVDVLGAY
ncbi:FKBP-type peptidyl-prolyl cis-trans isomerase [Nonomuraea sp. NPDC059194]|uniref:FKBP-type peptidyl-prolyl cis-trans isomerase n=1 Tax=Nonomuraea sp. NPDC059194 TaxID=3346764 RepID=UPI0036B2A6C4